MIIKPSSEERRLLTRRKKKALQHYRSIQAAKAIERDDDCCVFCYFLLGKKTRRHDIHHVYGRAREAGDKREHYTSLVCTCRKHHPQPILTPGGDKKLEYVEAVLKEANEHPINPNFGG